jgi:hypothetical protein
MLVIHFRKNAGLPIQCFQKRHIRLSEICQLRRTNGQTLRTNRHRNPSKANESLVLGERQDVNNLSVAATWRGQRYNDLNSETTGAAEDIIP